MTKSFDANNITLPIDDNIERPIDDNLENEIQNSKSEGPKPTTYIIPFRDWQTQNFAQKVWWINTKLLRFRKDNGRIEMDVDSYELIRPLSDTDKDDQLIIRDFLTKQDRILNRTLKNEIRKNGQLDPAVITADGFLINGNRRKMILDELYEETQDSKYENMKVVILPGKMNVDDELKNRGGPPTIKEIEQLESRYEEQSDGKAKYSQFNKALSMRRKIKRGYTLDQQMVDNSEYAHLQYNSKDFNKAKNTLEDTLLKPLYSIDEYLDINETPKLYTIVENKWDVFKEYYLNLGKKLDDPSLWIKYNIEEEDIYTIKEIAYKIIKTDDTRDIGRKSAVMRNLLKIIKIQESKKRLEQMNDLVDFDIPEEDKFNE